MASRAELEEEWREFQLWQRNQGLEYPDYLEWRDLIIARENMATLKSFIEGFDDGDEIKVSELREILKYV